MIPETLGRIKPHEDQQSAFADVHHIKTPQQARTIAGDFFEEAARILFAGQRRMTDSWATICPDIDLAERGHCEIKSVGRHRQAIVYERQVDASRRLMKTGKAVHWIFWHHRSPSANAKTKEDLRADLARTLDRVIVIRGRDLLAWCAKRKAKPVCYRSARGGERKEFLPAFRLSWGVLTRLSRGNPAASIMRKIRGVYGHDLTAEVVGRDLGAIFPALTGDERGEAAGMISDLARETHRIELRPAPRQAHRGQMIRVHSGFNPDWYRKLAATMVHPPRRKRPRHDKRFDTDIRRDRITRSLERLAAGRCRFPYDWMLREIIEERLRDPAGHER